MHWVRVKQLMLADAASDGLMSKSVELFLKVWESYFEKFYKDWRWYCQKIREKLNTSEKKKNRNQTDSKSNLWWPVCRPSLGIPEKSTVK